MINAFLEQTSKLSTPVSAEISEHLSISAAELEERPESSATFPAWQSPMIQGALDSLAQEGQLLVVGAAARTRLREFSDVFDSDAVLSSAEYLDSSLSSDEVHPCLASGLLFGYHGDFPVVARVLRVEWPQPEVTLAVMANHPDTARGFLDEVRRRMGDHNPYRGKALALTVDARGALRQIKVVPRPYVPAENIVLAPGVREVVEEHAVGVAAHAERLRRTGQHLKRGILLYGPPGSGKTHIVRYLAGRLPGTTLFTLTGMDMTRQLRAVASLLKDVAPAMVVLDDVDLIAASRDSADNAGADLFDLLDTMDGLSGDTDVLFVCTTNRLDEIESAIRDRPGRIDIAIEVALPDAEARRGMIELYGGGANARFGDVDSLVQRTAGVTASAIKDLVRQAALLALEESGSSSTAALTDRHIHSAIDATLGTNGVK